MDNYSSADSATHNFSCTDINKSRATQVALTPKLNLLHNSAHKHKGLGCTATISQIQGYFSPPAKVILKNLFPSLF